MKRQLVHSISVSSVPLQHIPHRSCLRIVHHLLNAPSPNTAGAQGTRSLEGHAGSLNNNGIASTAYKQSALQRNSRCRFVLIASHTFSLCMSHSRIISSSSLQRATILSAHLSRPRTVPATFTRTMASVPEKMKGVIIEKTGGTEVLQYKTDLPVPTPKEGQVLVKNDFIGINFIDVCNGRVDGH